MLKLRIIGVLALVMIISSCEKKQVTPEASQIIGLGSPVTLGFDRTEIVLEDYFRDITAIDRIILPEGLLQDEMHGGKLTLSGSIESPLGVIKVIADGYEYELLVKRSEKERIELTFDPADKEYDKVQLKGEMNSWNPSSTELEFDGDVWRTSMLVNKGIYQYLFVADGEEVLDPDNPDKVSNGMGGFNSLLQVGKTNSAKPVLRTGWVDDREVHFQLQNGSGLIVFWQNEQLEVDKAVGGFVVTIPEEAKAFDRSYIRAWGANDESLSNDLLIPLESGKVIMDPETLNRFDYQTWNMYFVLIDRFKDGNPANTRKVDDPDIHPKANYYGGDFAGITQTIKSGYFQEIGVNTLWLSPITQNPETAYGLWDQGGPVTKFSGYHGYWPVSSTKTDDRFGTEEEFRELLDVAHEHGMSVILDYVANHVHEEHPVYKQHPDWATDLYLPDGRLNTELWEEQRLTTWFDTFMPTLDFSKPEVIEAMTDTALFWVKEYDLDGFRHDATKHIQLEFWRTLTRKIREKVTEKTGKQIYQVGETYGSRELISSYINSGMLDAQFDFNMYDAALNAFGQNTSFKGLRDQINESFNYYGHHNLMGYISGNHDKPRFITLTSGEVSWNEDAKLAGWTREIGNPQEFAYDKLNMLHAWNMTIPGIPVTYYGDEFGMPGANDPDNRRWMVFDDTKLDAFELRNRNIFSKLTELRNTNMPLLYGDFEFHLVEDDVLAYSRAYFNKQVVVVINKTGKDVNVEVPLRDDFDYTSLESHFGHEFELNSAMLQITLPANSFEILTL